MTTHLRTVHTSAFIRQFKEPEKVPQPAEPLNKEEREIDHMMRCTKVGCLRCA